MKKLLFTLAMATLAASLAPSAQADPPAGGAAKATIAVQSGKTALAARTTRAARVSPARSARAAYHLQSFRGWTSYCWFPQYRCYGYYSTADGLWFYWYAPLNRFLPVSYMALYPPTAVGLAPVSPIAGTPGLLGAPGTPGIVPPGVITVPTAPPVTPPPGTTPLPSGPATPVDPMPMPPQ